MSDKPEPRHKRLSTALCEAVEFGHPTLIRMGMDDWMQLIASIESAVGWKVDLAFDKFENVSVQRERSFKGCVVEHDSRYVRLSITDAPHAISDAVVMMRDTKKPAIVAWN